MMKARKFPAHLLQASIDEMVNYFNEFTIRHPLFDAAFDELLDAIVSREKEPLIFVLGPSGVGKTTLRKILERKLINEALSALEADPERMPVASVEAVAAGFGNFKWKDYYVRALIALKEPLIHKKVLYANEIGLSVQGSRGSTAALRRALEKTLGYRRPSVFIIDEAQHLAKISPTSRLEEQLDCIKSLANMTGVKHVLFGTYDLREFRNRSAQLNNRSKDIQLRRYDARNAQDRHIFKSIISTFEHYLPLQELPDLVQHVPFLMERSVGCVGTLKLWLTRALRRALKDGAKSIMEDHLKATAPSIEKALKMVEEAIGGEAALTDDAKKKNKLLLLLGMAVTSPKKDTKTEKKTKKEKKFRPGKPKPRRNPIGGDGTGADSQAA